MKSQKRIFSDNLPLYGGIFFHCICLNVCISNLFPRRVKISRFPTSFPFSRPPFRKRSSPTVGISGLQVNKGFQNGYGPRQGNFQLNRNRQEAATRLESSFLPLTLTANSRGGSIGSVSAVKSRFTTGCNSRDTRFHRLVPETMRPSAEIYTRCARAMDDENLRATGNCREKLFNKL